MKYICSYDPQSGKQMRIVAETPKEREMLRVTQEVIGFMGHHSGEATTGHQPFFDYDFSGHDTHPGESMDTPSALGFRVVTFSHDEARRQGVHRSKTDRDYFLTNEEQVKNDKRNGK